MRLQSLANPLARLPMRRRVALVGLYLAVILPLLIYFNVGLTPDSLIFILLGAALLAGRPVLFLRDWGVFLLILVLWQQTGPVAKWAGFPLHMQQLIAFDKALTPWMHGVLPQVWLQQHFYHAGYTVRTHYHAGFLYNHVYHPAYWDHVHYPAKWQWYDLISVLVYALHFPEPLIVGFAIWLSTRKGFQRYATAYLVLAGLAFIGYIVYPAVPPWMASRFGAIPQVHDMFDEFNRNVLTQGFGHHYKAVLEVKYNRTAAMPSLHAAFPLLSALYLRKTFGAWGLLMLLYAAVVWVAVVYLGEHWIVDVLVGLGCAVLAYALVEGTAWAWARVGRARMRQSASATEATAAMSALSHKAGPGR